jgi:YVTN family beta-propeller protein
MIYVANCLDNTVSVINGYTNTVVQTIPVGINPDGVGVDPITNMICVANVGANTVSVINGNTNTVVQTIPVGNYPTIVGVNPMTVSRKRRMANSH